MVEWFIGVELLVVAVVIYCGLYDIRDELRAIRTADACDDFQRAWRRGEP